MTASSTGANAWQWLECRISTWLLLRQTLAGLRSRVYWVNSDHMYSDPLTKLSGHCCKTMETFLRLLRTGTFQISYDEVAARKAARDPVRAPTKYLENFGDWM